MLRAFIDFLLQIFIFGADGEGLGPGPPGAFNILIAAIGIA